jgi:hypothetical protein
MSCAQDMSANTPGLCIYNTLKTIPGITSLEAYGKDADFIRYFYRDAQGKETSSTLMIGTSGTPPRTWFEGAFPIVPDDPVAKGGGPIADKCDADPRLMDQTLAVGGSPTMTWRRAN